MHPIRVLQRWYHACLCHFDHHVLASGFLPADIVEAYMARVMMWTVKFEPCRFCGRWLIVRGSSGRLTFKS